MKTFSAILLFFAIICHVKAENYSIHGKIVSGNNPVEYANIVLQTSTDSSFVNGGISDRRGRFDFENVASGNYNLTISAMGYNTRKIALSDFNKTMDMGTIELDSATIMMDEVVVKASHVIRQPDKQIYLPTSHQIKASTNGVDILQQMKMGRLQVDPMRMTITSSNEGEVQLRINGGKAEIQEIQSLRPEDIQRIDYYDDPSLRFGNKVAVVIDYITKHPQAGGYIGLQTNNSPHTGFGNNSLTAKFNHKKSEITVNYWGMYRSLKDMWTDRLESFNYEDGSTFTRQSDGIPSTVHENHHYVTVGYSYQEPEKWSFIAKLRGNIDDSSMNQQSILYPVSNPTNSVNMLDDSKDRSTRPSIDLYFQRQFKNKQMLILNLVGTYINTSVHRFYSESRDGSSLTDIKSKTDGDKYSIIGQAVYEKDFTKSKLSLGTNFNYAYTDNLYTGNVNTITRMHDYTNMIYAEYSGRQGKFNYKLGLSGIYGGYTQGDVDYSKFVLSPDLRVGYTLNSNSSIRLKANINYWTPDLSNLSDVEQLIDSLQVRRGNPNLKETRCYSTSVYYEYRKGLLYANFNLFYQYQYHPMMEQIYRENNKFIFTTLNQPNWQKVNPEIELKVGPIKDILNISVTGGMNYYDSKGTNYHHTYTNWYWRGRLSAMYKNFNMGFEYRNHENDFYGESLSYGECYHMMNLNYKFKHGITVGVMAFNPFVSSYRRPSENRNQYASSKECMYLSKGMRIIALNFNWNLSFGRKYKSVDQKLDNEDTKSGTLKGSR